jgi:hypothetical protein
VSAREIVLSGISLRRSFPNESLGLLGTALLLVAWPAYADQSDPVQAVPVQPDGAALMQKIRDLEDRVRRGRFAGLKTEQAPPRQPATTAVPNCRVGYAGSWLPAASPASVPPCGCEGGRSPDGRAGPAGDSAANLAINR